MNSWRRLHCTKIRAKLLYPRLDFADSAVAILTRKKNWSACPFQWVIRLPTFPYLMKHFFSNFLGIEPRWIVEGNGGCCSHSCRPSRAASSCRCLPPILICSDALLLFDRFKSREEDGRVVHHPGSLMPSSQAASLMPTFSELHIY